jgi:3-hydroxyacyl-CoA dehydrogenase
VERVAVLGAGTMGSRIAAHFANAGIPSLLLDIVVTGQPDRSAAARKGVENALRQKPGAFYSDAFASRVTPGNFDDHLDDIASCDWVIEAVTENLEIKRSLWRKVELARKPGAILSTNTSGIPLARISDGFSPEFRRDFLGTHFFNPPRYLRLVEVIPTPYTEPAVAAFASEFCDRRLGKGVVICKDTPNFIANRIGSFFGGTIGAIMMEGGYTIEEVDALTGPLIGLPNSATFRLLDIVGIDVWDLVGGNLYRNAPGDRWRDRFLSPPFMQQMLARQWLGEKTGQGFYRRVGQGADRKIEAIDWKTLEYHTARKVSFPEIEAARNIEDLGERLRALLAAPGRGGAFLWKLFRDLLVYAAERVPEISDRIVEIDRAMRWGYAHKLGPFELWDALGFAATARRIEQDGLELPPLVRSMLDDGAESFYRAPAGSRHTEYYDLAAGAWAVLDPVPGSLALADVKSARGVVRRNAGASLVDLGDGVLCLEFHSKMNAIGEDAIAMIHAAIEETARDFLALVVGNEGENFSVGANLVMVLLAAQEGDWEELGAAVHRFQQANLAIKYSPRPVVAAPFGQTLGGGAEIVLHAARVQASAELYMGLVEVGVGLIPGGGGCKELLAKLKDPRRVFELIGYAKVSTSAENARELGLIGRGAGVTMNPARRIADAKALALAAAAGYAPPARESIAVAGEPGYAILKMGAWLARQAEYISDHDMAIAGKLAGVLSGGRLTSAQNVPEQYLLDLEREAFLSLCGMPRTQERMAHMLKTGKPLRN